MEPQSNPEQPNPQRGPDFGKKYILRAARINADRGKFKAIETTSPTPTELTEMADIYARAFAGPPWFEQWDIPKAEEELRGLMKKGATFIMLERASTIAAFAISYDLSEFRAASKLEAMGSRADAFYLAEVAVRPEFQGDGLAGKLMEKTKEVAQSLGKTEIVSQTRSDNEAMIRVFERSNLELIGTHEEVTGGQLSERKVFQLKLS